MYATAYEEIKKILSSNLTDQEKIQSLKDLAYTYFAGSDFIRINFSDNYKILKIIFYVSHPLPTDIASVFLRTLEDKIERENKEKTFIENKEEPTEAIFPAWHEGIAISGEEEIKISHGGGKKFIDLFFQKANIGYAEQTDKKGIYVTVHHKKYSDATTNNRDFAYATRTPLEHFDDPVTIKGTIKAKYLWQANSNVYEAVLPPENIGFFSKTEEKVWKLLSENPKNRCQFLAQIAPVGRKDFLTGSYDYSFLLEKLKEKYCPERLERIKEYLHEVRGHLTEMFSKMW